MIAAAAAVQAKIDRARFMPEAEVERYPEELERRWTEAIDLLLASGGDPDHPGNLLLKSIRARHLERYGPQQRAIERATELHEQCRAYVETHEWVDFDHQENDEVKKNRFAMAVYYALDAKLMLWELCSDERAAPDTDWEVLLKTRRELVWLTITHIHSERQLPEFADRPALSDADLHLALRGPLYAELPSPR